MIKCITTTNWCSHCAPAGVARHAATSAGSPANGAAARQPRSVLRATPNSAATCRSGCPCANWPAASPSCSARSKRVRCFTVHRRSPTRLGRVANAWHLG
ncbi:hypothetical protein [Lamprocystis purpurea]|uniref:hypothetical protein n=1 Tax=Lamprocystis purpurea TaxID=61598 RepID=UPI001FE060B9|nr:hypothetical protein [Lamprocystis purpurea]